MEKYLAHFHKKEDKIVEQPLWNHCFQAAVYAKNDLKSIELGVMSYLAELLHDTGKYTDEAQDYLRAAAAGKHVVRGSVNHTFAGVRLLLENYHNMDQEDVMITNLAAEILAFAIGSHHGLFDCVDSNGKDGYDYRRKRESYNYIVARERFLSDCVNKSKLDELFSDAAKEMEVAFDKLQPISRNLDEMYFYLGLLARLIASAVIDGDRRDTAEFKLQMKYKDYPDDMSGIWKARLAYLEDKLEVLPQETEIEKARQRFSEQCLTFSEKPDGIYRLSLPTGGGKTLASLRAALACAAEKNKKRIIYAIPLLSVLDQNSVVIHEYLGDDTIILEHHSNVIQEKNNGELDEIELIQENWSSPVIITTLVQVFLCLFDGKPSAIRRMQSLCNSVLIIDEVQSVPLNLLSLFNLSMNFLSNICHTTILLCSATQPCLEKTDHALYKTPEELVPYNPEEWKVFRRTVIDMPETMIFSDISSAIKEDLSGSLLFVCNTKKEAAELYSSIDGIEKYHLSGAMCMAHRKEVLKKVREVLDDPDHGAFICVSTQLIESGVHVSFEKVIRMMAGLDNIIQTAGRCNRNGERENPASVRVFRCADENLTTLKEIRNAQNAAEALFEEYETNPAEFSFDLFSDEAVNYYYKKLYASMAEGAQDGPLDGHPTLYELCCGVPKYLEKCSTVESYFMRQSLAEAGKCFRVFDQDTIDVIVPYQGGKDVIADICSEKATHDLSFLSETLKRAKPFIVSIFQNQKEQLEKEGRLIEVNNIFILREYDDELGAFIK